MSPLDAAWEAVLAAPDDDRALQVLADALMEVGDPHGELIRRQLAGEDVQHHLTQHAAELFGDWKRLSTWAPRFSRGFLTSVQIAGRAELEAALALPVARLLREVDLSPLMTDPIEGIAGLLATRGPRTLRTIFFGRGGADPEHPDELIVAPLTQRLTSLTTLWLGTWPAQLAGVNSASLKELTLNLQVPVRGLGEARFPQLERLFLELPFRRLELPLSLLSGEVAPKLDSLTISGALWPQQLTELSVSALVRGLKRVELAAEAETGWYPTLLETLDSWAHLEELVLVADRHHPEWVAAVKAALPRARIRPAQLRL